MQKRLLWVRSRGVVIAITFSACIGTFLAARFALIALDTSDLACNTSISRFWGAFSEFFGGSLHEIENLLTFHCLYIGGSTRPGNLGFELGIWSLSGESEEREYELTKEIPRTFPLDFE